MKKCHFLSVLTIALAFSQAVSANPIYSTQALKNAFAFLQEKGISVAPNGMRRAPSSNHSGELAPYYVFNLGDDKGFVIASGDDCAYPVLAYSDKGSMKLDSLPDNVKYWLDFYEAQVNSLKGSEAAASRPRNAPRAVVEPMLTTKWGQGEPYNLQCPVHPSFGSRCLTGCVATAMAQVMYYHRKNSTRQLTTYLPGYTCTNGEIQVPEVPKGSPIGWDDMIEDYEDNANCTREQKQAVAALMFYCGSSVRMSYGLAGSGAVGSAIPSALIKYFDYDDGVKMYERTNYSNTEWESMVYEELAAGNPIAYLGTRSNYEGHCFVVDGCDADGYVHINWGWKGQSDGYFLLTASSGNGNPVGGWTLYQEAMFGAVPNGDFPRLTTQSITLQSAETVEGLSSNITFPVSFTMTVANLTDSQDSFKQAMGLYKNGQLQSVVKTLDDISNLAVNGTKTMNVSLNMDATLPNGVYQLVPLSRATGTDKWRKNGNYDKMLTVVINGDKAKIVVGVPPVEGDIITFACNDVKHLCVENWDLNGDGEFSKEEAAAVSSLGKVFKENSSITSFGELVFFTGLTTIDGEAFRACEKLASVIIPENVETIGKYAFYYNDLKNIVIPKSVKEIGTYAFSGNKDIEDIRVESGNTSYDSRQGCHALVETATSTLLQGSKKTVIPDGIKAIGYNAFLECEWLGEMYIPESVTSIENGAFGDCVNLKTVNIPKGVTKIGAKAFQRTAISSLFIPEKVEKIDIWAFYGCPNLAKIVVDEKNAVYDSRNGCNAILEKATNKLIQGCQTTVIPQGTESIGDYAFCGCNGLKTINIPGSVKSIGYEAFFYCDNLVRVDVSEGVETIGMYAFKGCDNLTTLTLPSTIYQIQWRAFDCDNLATVAVKMNNPIRLYDESFTRSYMATLYVPEGCASRYQDASYWKDFKNIVEGDIPQRDLIDFADMTVKNLCIEHWDTDGDRELSKEEAAAVKDLGTVFEENQQLTSFDELQYFTGLEKIGEDAFFEASNLESVTLPLQLKSIENGAFALCEKLQQIVVPKNVTAIGDVAFSRCSSLASVSLPEGLQSLGNVAFGSCSKLSKLTIPTSVTTIGYKAFYGCGITSLFIPKNLTSIGYGIAGGCNQLASIKVDAANKVYDSRSNSNGIIVTATNELIQGCRSTVIPNTVTSISGYAFQYCASLESIVIPASVVSIAYDTYFQAFMGCDNLVSIKVDPANTVYDSRDNCNAIIQGNVLICGCQATIIPNGVTEIGEYAFYCCNSLKSIVIPNGVTEIGEYAFYCCNSLKSIVIPEGVKTLKKSAFSGCGGLASIHLPSKMREIPRDAFAKCESLEHVIIPNNIEYIGDGAFRNCSRLKSVSISSQVQIISQGTFSNCGQLTSVVVKREEPPMLPEYTFENQDHATLYVPKGCSEAYRNTRGGRYSWYLFGKIVELTDVKGDVNLDGKVTITDVIVLVNAILKNSDNLPDELEYLKDFDNNTMIVPGNKNVEALLGEMQDFPFEYADMNDDGVLNITDVIILVDHILQ